MWDGPRQGPRGGPPFRGDQRGDMFGNRDGPMPDFRGRDGMNMGPMGPMGLRNQDMHMDMRRMDGPPAMRGRDMEPFDMRGREQNRDFCRPGNDPDFTLRRQFEMAIRDKLMNVSGFMGQGRNSSDIGGRGMPNDRFMDMRDREMFRNDMPGFSNNNMDSRRGFPMDPMGRNEGFRDRQDRPPMGMDNIDGFNMDMPPRDRGMMDFDRRGGPPFNARGGFKSDMDFRNRGGPSAEMMGRDRSPMRFGENDGAPMDVRGRSDVAPDLGGPNRSKFTDKEGPHKDRAFPDSRATPPLDFRGGEEMTLAEEWKSRRAQEKNASPAAKGMGDSVEQRFPPGLSREGKDLGAFGFPRGDRFADLSLPPIGQKGLLDTPFPVIGNLPGSLNRENESKRWSGDRDLKQSPNTPSRDARTPYNQDKNQLVRDVPGPRDVGAPKDKISTGPEFQSSVGEQRKDQDYRDIDYRTGSGRVFDYKHEELQGTANVLKESKESSPSKFSGTQDQDYRSATVKDKVSHTISIIGIPKTATMEQILGAFAVRDGVPMQGMKIKSVVPGYSYDTAYVEFLNLEDAVHFMESNKGSLKVGTKIASMKYIQPGKSEKDAPELGGKGPLAQEPLLPSPGKPQEKPKSSQNGSQPKPMEPPGQRQRSSDLTPEAWQQQVDQRLRLQETEQQAEAWANRNPPRHGAPHSDPIFKESKTMIIKNVKPTTTVETILKALDPFAYLDERNVRLVKGKPPGAKCFCFVDMDSHEQVTRLVELLTKPRPLSIDGVRVYAEVAKPLKNQKKEFDKSNTSLLGYPTEAHMLEQQQYYHGLQPPMDSSSAAMQGDPTTGSMAGSMNPASMSGAHMDPSYSQGVGYGEAPPMDPSFQVRGSHGSDGGPGMAAIGEPSEAYIYGSETPDMSSYLFDATSGFYYDPQTTLYYDPGSRYFYNAQTQGYLYWDSVTKSYIPVPGGGSTESPAVAMAPDMQAILSNPAADAPLELKKPSDPKAPDPPPPALVTSGGGAALLAPSPGPAAPHSPTQEAAPCPLSGTDRREDDDAGKKDKEDKPRSLAAFKIMKDMERWAKIQNRQKETVRAPSPVLKIGAPDDRKASKAADAAFAIFKGGDDLFKKPLAPPKNEEKSSKRPMGSLGLLASDYAATGSDEEVEEEKQQQMHDPPRVAKSQAEDKEDKLTDWKKMACLLCRRQFPNKDALVRHQQLSDLHKQNMEIHLKIKRSKKELEALENQEKELGLKEPAPSPEPKRRKHQHHHHHQQQQQQQQQHHGSWAGGSRDSHKMSERPGLGSEPVERKKKEPVWDHATYKQAVRKAMFARFKELD